MKTARSILITVIVLAIAVIIVAGVAWLTRLRSEPTVAAPAGAADPSGVFADKQVTDCSAVELPPPGQEINTVLDYYSKKLQISYWDSRLRGDRVIYISYEEPACQERSEIKSIIDGALEVHAQTVTSMCRSMAEVVRQGKSIVTSPQGLPQKVDLEAAKRFLERWCK